MIKLEDYFNADFDPNNVITIVEVDEYECEEDREDEQKSGNYEIIPIHVAWAQAEHSYDFMKKFDYVKCLKSDKFFKEHPQWEEWRFDFRLFCGTANEDAFNETSLKLVAVDDQYVYFKPAEQSAY